MGPGRRPTVRRRVDFYTGRVLRLDLTALTATVEPLDADWARLYVGGKGLLLRYLFAELAPGTDALAPENPLILASGPFAGTAAATCSRLAVGCKSPATGTLLDSYVGGSFAPELKFAGYDVVVVDRQGAAPGARADRGRPGGLPAGRGPLLGPRDGGPRAEGARGDGPVAQGPLHGPRRRAARPLRLPLHRPVPQGRARRRRRRDGQQEPQGRRGARHRRGHRRRRGRLRARPARAAERPHPHRRTTPGPTRRARRSSSTSSTPPARCRRATGARASSRARTASTPRQLLEVRTKIRACTQCPLACRQVHRFGDHVCEGPEFETLGLCGANCGIGDLAAIAAFNRRLRRARPGHDVHGRRRGPGHGPLRAGRRRLRPRLRRRRPATWRRPA